MATRGGRGRSVGGAVGCGHGGGVWRVVPFYGCRWRWATAAARVVAGGDGGASHVRGVGGVADPDVRVLAAAGGVSLSSCWLLSGRWHCGLPTCLFPCVLSLSLSVSAGATRHRSAVPPSTTHPHPSPTPSSRPGRRPSCRPPLCRPLLPPAQFFRAARAEASDQLLQELIQTVADKCFAKCITKPGTSLTGGESACLAKCMDRFLEARTLVVKALENQQ